MCYEVAKGKGKLPIAKPPKNLAEANEIMGKILKASKAAEKQNEAAKLEQQSAFRPVAKSESKESVISVEEKPTHKLGKLGDRENEKFSKGAGPSHM